MADVKAVVTAEHEHYWMPDALCIPVLPNHATVLFRCRVTGCGLLAYGHTAPAEIQEPRG